MGLFTATQFDSLESLLIDQLEALYDAEQRLRRALPTMAQAAHDSSLKAEFQQNLRETQNQVRRLARAFQLMGRNPEGRTCQAMKGLIREAQEVVDADGDPEVKDAALIAAAQCVEHYEIAGYGSARTFAHYLCKPEVARLLQEALDEEKTADRKLTQLAERTINQQAAMAGR
jgi:ferritin-like metal-binding protein YciE